MAIPPARPKHLPRRAATAPPRPRWLVPLLGLFYLYLANQYPHWKDTNPCSRVYQTLAMVDDGELAIDNCLPRYGNTQAKAEHHGRYFSDKPPGVAFWLAPWARLVRLFIPAEDFEGTFYWLRAVGLSLPAAVFWWGVWPRFAVWAGSAPAASAIVIVGSLGSGWLPYSTALYSHVPAGMLLFLSFVSLREAWAQTDARRRAALALLAGLLAGGAFICDFVVLLAVPVLGTWALVGGRGRLDLPVTVAWGAGLFPPLAAWMLYNAACFGGPLSVGFLSHSDANFAQAYRGGWLGMQPPDWAALPGLLFSPARGLFFVTPALLLGPWGLWRACQKHVGTQADSGGELTRGEALVCAATCAAILVFATTTVDWRAGWSYGPRYLMPAVPFLMVGMATAVRSTSNGGAWALLSGGGVVGVVWAMLSMLTTPLWVQEFRNPVVWFCGPTLGQGHVARTLASDWLDVWSALPVVVAMGLILAWLVSWPCIPGSTAKSSSLQHLRRTTLTIALLWAGQMSIPEWQAASTLQEIQRAELLIRLGYLDAARASLNRLDPLHSAKAVSNHFETGNMPATP